MKNIPELDGFRCLAITMVILFHYGVYIGNNYIDAFAGTGWIGVPLFFIMSGFLISLPFIKKGYDKAPPPILTDFYKKRILRIFPLYFFSLTVFIVIHFAVNYIDNFSTFKVIYHLFFLHNFYPGEMINSVYWSLAVEIHFYILFPLIGYFIHKKIIAGQIAQAIVGVLAVIIISFGYRMYICYYVSLVDYFVYLRYIYYNTLANLESFGYGIIAAIVFVFFLRKEKNILHPVLQLTSIVALLLPLYLLMLYAFNNGVVHFVNIRFMPVFFYSGINILLTLLIILSLSTTNTLINKVLSLKPFVFISTLSYSIYIWHLPIYFSVEYLIKAYLPNSTGTLMHILGVAASLLFTFTLSVLTYHYIEKPFLKLKDIKDSVTLN
jgi:peptidoglycan/LPS O-acetylase OafA/YrhL